MKPVIHRRETTQPADAIEMIKDTLEGKPRPAINGNSTSAHQHRAGDSEPLTEQQLIELAARGWRRIRERW